MKGCGSAVEGPGWELHPGDSSRGTLPMLSHLKLSIAFVVLPPFYSCGMMLREVMGPAQGHTASGGHWWDRRLGLQPKPKAASHSRQEAGERVPEPCICLEIKGHWAPKQSGDPSLAVTERADPFLAQTASQKGVQDWGSCG